jgi:V8-like Glu-specific endopeptidase
MAGIGLRRGTGFAVLAIAALAAAAPASASAAHPAAAGVPVITGTGSSLAGARAYWTSARMRAAQPIVAAAPSSGAASAATPRTATARRARIATPLAHVKRRPLRTAGKVFFSAGLFDYECSGTAVRAPSQSLVVTAGHCGYFLAPMVQHWVFVPAYRSGKAPFGKWPATKLAAPSGWANATPPPVVLPSGEPTGGDSRYDVSAATVAERHGRTLQSVVGSRKIAFGERRDQRYKAIGYPAEAPFNGLHEYDCSSGYTGSDHSLGDPAPISITCDMTGGSSGGGWLDAHGRMVSLTSYGYSNQPNTLYGPYFGDAIAEFYRSVRSG